MTVAQSIVRTTFMIKELAAWLEADVHKGGFCEAGSMSEIDLTLAANTFRHLADTCDERRQALLANRPSLVKENTKIFTAEDETKMWVQWHGKGNTDAEQ